MKKLISILLFLLFLAGMASPARADSVGTIAPEPEDGGNAVPTMASTDWVDYDYDTVDAVIFAEEESLPTVLGADAIKAPHAILVEKDTGTVLFEKDADARVEPASVTKVMTILLIVEAIEKGVLSPDDTVTCSATAASMGGSQIYLEEGETMTVSDLLKAIVVASANDACVAMAEELAGTESAFVERMNQRAKELGMENTTFCNCTGLPGEEQHLTTARDISIMSRELIRHDSIKEYTTIWMDTLRDGEFGLNNTNKLIYYFSGATGLKTGFTASAKYCLSATAQRDGVEYIAVVLGCDSSADRFESAKAMLSYGFANYTLLDTNPQDTLAPIPVSMGMADTVEVRAEDSGKLLVPKGEAQGVTTHVETEATLEAPVAEGAVVGHITLESGDKTLAVIPVITVHGVERRSWWNLFTATLNTALGG